MATVAAVSQIAVLSAVIDRRFSGEPDIALFVQSPEDTRWRRRGGQPGADVPPNWPLRRFYWGFALSGSRFAAPPSSARGDGFDYNYRECKDCCGLW